MAGANKSAKAGPEPDPPAKYDAADEAAEEDGGSFQKVKTFVGL